MSREPLPLLVLPILVLAPARDAQLSARVLADAGHRVESCANPAELLERLRAQLIDVGALLVAQECLSDRLLGDIAGLLKRQPPGADLPVLLVSRNADPTHEPHGAQQLGNVTVLTRPMAVHALASAANAALRARHRQRELVEAMHELRDQARRKDEFLAMLAHELRNPLAPVRYAAQALLKTASSPQQERLCAVLDRQVSHMSHIIEQLLDVSRLTQGKVTLERQVLDLGVLVNEAMESTQALAREKGIALHTRIQPGVWVQGDPTRLLQVLDNLLDNSLKFTPAGGEIDVVLLQSAAGDAVLAVQDTGEGLEAEVLPHLFEPFTQADKTLDRARGGLGLGLAVVHGVVTLHGGRVSASSPGAGRGSRFTVSLPAAAAPSAPAFEPAPVDGAMHARRVLIVEDNADAAETLRLLLELSSCEVTVIHNGAEALATARRVRPQVVVCDIGLPGMSGYEVAASLRADPELRGMRLFAITGYGTREDRAAALAAGFDGHFAKPVEPAALLEAIAASSPTAADAR